MVNFNKQKANTMRKYIAIATLAVLASCNSNTQKSYIQLNGFAQGTTYSITYFDPQNRNFENPVENIIEKVDSSMSLYRDNSIINRFNRSETGLEVDALLAQVINLSLLYGEQTNHTFDITVGPLVKAWGFHLKKGEVPNNVIIEHLKPFIGLGMIECNGLFIKKKYPEVMIDVNAIAQGFTVDLISEFFEEQGIKDYLVELGGEIRSLGKSPRNKKWLVGIDKPIDNAGSGENLQVIIGISGKSLVTSGNYRKFFVRNGVKYSHTIDPGTGYPVTHSLLSSTVVDKTSARADALATAFMVMGLDKTKQWLSENPEVDAYLIYTKNDGEYGTWMTYGFEKRIID